MRWTLSILALATLLAGCRATTPPAVMHDRQANLALGPTRDHTWLAQAYIGRSPWPAVSNGFRSEEITVYNITTYDEQRSYDRHHGLFYGMQSTRSGMRVR